MRETADGNSRSKCHCQPWIGILPEMPREHGETDRENLLMPRL